MNPHTYATLYGPWQPARQLRKGRTAVRVLAGILWAVTFASLAWLMCLVSLTAVWGLAAGAPVGSFLLRCALTVTGSAAALAALYFAPGIRRLATASRLLLVGAVACPVPTGLAIWTWFQTG
ncbi:hypothetical protein [Streptomyces sp. ISL-100]|uniref:hypothetical protein n=1 Tax=Streptomyces sp. ISL-100 TaxID=2819173 RepID=UPI001BE9D17E|nr:hypothetical protein [Streptomyces sp. ISL-100]MBT2398541.1 hypothetical protein [Streptomyces sp. ISL-100]